MRRFRTAAFALGFLPLLILLFSARPAAAGLERWTPFGPAEGDASAVVVDPSDASTIWIVSGGTVYKSTDGGVSWRSASRGLVGVVAYLAGDPGRPETLYAAMSSASPGIFRSDGGGANWLRVVGSRRDFVSIWSLAVAPSETPGGRGVVWVGTVLSVFRSRDGGATWKEVLGNHHSAEIYVSVAPDPLHPGTVYAANLNHRYKTTDGGDHWQQLQEIPGEFQPRVNAFAVAPSDPQTLYESGGPLYRSHDGGATWEGPFPFQFDRLAVDPVDPDLVYGGSIRGLFVSHDGGESFRRATGGLPDYRYRHDGLLRRPGARYRSRAFRFGLRRHAEGALRHRGWRRHLARSDPQRPPDLSGDPFPCRSLQLTALGGRAGRGPSGDLGPWRDVHAVCDHAARAAYRP